MNEQEQVNFSDLPREIQRRLVAAFEKDRLAPKPLRAEMNGAVRVDASDRTYAIARDGSLRRVQVAEDGFYAVKKWSKAKRKKMRRQLRARALDTAGPA